eukprot:gene20416-24454_t
MAGNATLNPRQRYMEAPPHLLSILQKAQRRDVKMLPFPYLVVRNALPKELYSLLAADFPTIKRIMDIGVRTPFARMQSNTRYDIPGSKSITNRKLSPLLQKFVQYHVSPAFYQEVLRVFGAAIRTVRPDVERKARSKLENITVVMRQGKNVQKAAKEMTVDCQIGMNSPVRTMSKAGVRGPHHDALSEVWGALLYLRDDKDKSTGGDLQIYSCKGKCKVVPESQKKKRNMQPSYHQQFDFKDLKLAATAPYKKNTLVWFINSDHSVHAVTPRR